MPKIEVWYTEVIGRSTEVLKTFRSETAGGAKFDKGRLERLYPECNVIIIKKKEFVAEIEKNIKLPKTQIPIDNNEHSAIFHLE